jgi:hypothetical protein
MFRWFLLLTIAAAVAAYWRPDWRVAAQRAATPWVKRAAAPVIERVRAWRGWRSTPAPVARPRAAPEAAPPAERAGEHGNQVAAAPPAEERREDQARPEEREDRRGPDEAAPAEETPAETAVEPAGNLPPRLPAPRAALSLPSGLHALQQAAEGNPSATGYRRLADAAAAAGFPAVAAEAYLREAAVYRRLGDPNAAAVEELKEGRYRAEGRLYLHTAEQPPRSLDTGARLEPPYGALLGAFIDRDDQLQNSYQDENWQTHRDEGEFERVTGKKHGSLFCYLEYGKPFPYRWAERLRDAGVAPHIAWEPRSLARVQEDAYLTRFADQVARLDAPIFLRFAGEMNGEWTPYHGDPALYRQRFRLVYRVIHRRAPKAALIWCVNSVPETGIEAYYPGDDAVDWVGVNLYNVLYFDNVRSRPADHVHPADLLQGIYRRYAARKPIALCEYAASHLAAVDPRPRPEFAATRMAQLYASLPRLFPRVKLVDWYDCDNLRHARPDRQLNDYSLTDEPRILEAYRRSVHQDYFLSSLEDRPRETIRPLGAEEAVSGIVTFSAWVRGPLDRPRVYILADDQVLYAGDEPGAPVCRWDARRARPGTHTIRLLVLDRENRRIMEERQRVRVAPGPTATEN